MQLIEYHPNLSHIVGPGDIFYITLISKSGPVVVIKGKMCFVIELYCSLTNAQDKLC